MEIEKKKFEEKLEQLLKKFGNNIEILGKDISDVILFLNIYGGDQKVVANEVQLKFFGLQSPKVLKGQYTKTGSEAKVKREGNQKGTVYTIKSYDSSIQLSVTLSRTYLKIEKLYDGDLNYYLAEYVFDEETNFVRRAKQKSNPLGRELDFSEVSQGNFKRGVCYSKITESSQAMEVKFFKIPTTKGEELYYSYFAKPDLFFQFKTPKFITTIPSITSIGMKALNELLERQFSEDFIRIEDQTLFKKLEEISKNFLNEQKNLK